MNLSRSIALGVLCTMCLPACTFEQGQAWAQVEPTLSVSFDASSRLTDEGRLRIGDGYEVKLDALSIEVTSLRVDAAPEALGQTSFDPAMPPSGYSLCHNGHCHADDGRLVDYEDIALELQAASGVVSASNVIQAYEDRVDLTRTPRTTLTADPELCSNSCGFESRGELARVVVRVSRMAVRGTVYDVSDRARLAREGLPFDETIDWDLELARVVEGSIGEDALYLDVQADIEVDDDLFGGVPWPQIAEGTSTLADHFTSVAPITLNIDTQWSHTP